mgnify:CR=1 FL=1
MPKFQYSKNSKERWLRLAKKGIPLRPNYGANGLFGSLTSTMRKQCGGYSCVCYACDGLFETYTQARLHVGNCALEDEFRIATGRYIEETRRPSAPKATISTAVIDAEAWVLWNAKLLDDNATMKAEVEALREQNNKLKCEVENRQREIKSLDEQLLRARVVNINREQALLYWVR